MSKVLVVTYLYDNGYRCSCCRSEWAEDSNFDLSSIISEYGSIKKFLDSELIRVREEYVKNNEDGRFDIDKAVVVEEWWQKSGNSFRLLGSNEYKDG